MRGSIAKMANWTVSHSEVASTPPLKPVVTYRAVISADMEDSTIFVESGIDRKLVAAAVEKPSEWESPWAAPPGASTDDVLSAALNKLRVLFDFGAELEGGSATAIRDQIKRVFSVELNTGARRGPHYKRFEVLAHVLEDGTATWGYEVPERGEWPPGFDNPSRAKSAPILDVVLQNIVRADLYARLGSP